MKLDRSRGPDAESPLVIVRLGEGWHNSYME
jgi:hypothetical protein